ncbi:hypothetical protein ACTQ4Q_09180 [Bacillota bacterium LCP21S3_D9]
MNKRAVLIGLAFLLAAVFLLRLDVFDSFYHGYFTDAVSYDRVDADSVLGTYNLADGEMNLSFVPLKSHLAGFVLYLENSADNTGCLNLQIYDEKGELVKSIQEDLSKIQNEHEYIVQSNIPLKQNVPYLLKISAQDYRTAPSLIIVSDQYRAPESADNGVLIGYAYGNPTFKDTEKYLLTILVFGLCLLMLKRSRGIGVFIVLMLALAWNYSFNSFDVSNDKFDGFQGDSEALVTKAIQAKKLGLSNSMGAGLLSIDTYQGPSGTGGGFDTDDEWIEGYHRTDPAISLRISEFSREYVIPGNYIQFANGEVHQIQWTQERDAVWMTVALDIESPIPYEKLGPLDGARILDENEKEVPYGVVVPYESQYGLQGRIFQHLSEYIDDLDTLRLYCALGTAFVLLCIVYLIQRKYNRLFAGIYYVVFLLSPWVVNFANNMYWVEFTWFVPMLAGLWCSMKTDSKKRRRGCYCLIFLSILIKSLCGYEYITTVMLGAISFLLIDLLIALYHKDKAKSQLIFRTVFWCGIAALLGFAAAICIHAPIKSGGSIVEGIRMIIQKDVLRRTYGADLNSLENLSDPEQYALIASAWETLCKYFHFKTEVITGIGGNLFPLLCLLPAVLLIRDVRRKCLDVREAAWYVVFFVTSVSWFVLAKSHSYVHTHMNFVLWYFGFVQSCFYIILKHLINWLWAWNNRSIREE